MMQRFRDLPIRFKLFIVYAAVSVLTFSVCFTVLFFQFQRHLETSIHGELVKSNQIVSTMLGTAARLSIKNYLSAIAEKNLEIIEMLYARSQAGELSGPEARQAAVQVLLSQQVGETGYIYCIDSDGFTVVHPHAEIRGRSYLGREFIQKQIEKKVGYLEYEWKDPGDDTPRSKALFMTYFEPWDWIISVSSYISEFSSLLDIESFKQEISGMALGSRGYSCVLDKNGNVVIHPELSGNLSDPKIFSGADVIRQMLANQKGLVTINQKKASGSACADEIVAYQHIPEFDWIVASSTCRDEVFWPIYETRQVFLLNLILSLVFTAFVTLLVSTSITKSLEKLIAALEKGVQEDFSLSIPVNRHDEVGRLSKSFNTFMSRLTEYRDGLIKEIKVRRETEAQLLLFEKVFENANEGISITDENGTIEKVNQAFTTITGYECREVIGQNPRVLKSDRHDGAFYREMWDSILQKGYWSGEIWNRRKSGEAYPELLSISAIKTKEGPVKNYVAVFHDISDMKRKEEQIAHMAYHDPLTGLPNRSLLKDRIRKAIAEAARTRDMIQILFVDLDNFKNVNDTIGHAKGDQLLREAAGRMVSVVRTSDTVSRLGGDEFVIVMTHLKDLEEMAVMVERVQMVFKEPFILDGKIFHMTCSIGISIFPEDGTDAETLISNADLAMYQAKKTGKNIHSKFENEMAERVRSRFRIEAELRKAIAAEEFQIYFQPRVSTRDFLPAGMEALVRWIKPDGTIISPLDFIPVAEASGLIVQLGELIFRKAVEGAGRLCEKSEHPMNVSINISARQFEDPGFISMVADVISRTGFPGGNIEMEITESLLVKDIEAATARLQELSKMGIMTAIDDFGTGYSSLAYIKRLPISVLKIDKSFIDDLPGDTESLVLVETIVLMANKLNLTIVAEGVETRQQLEALAYMGDMEIQGYLFSPPLPEERFMEWMDHRENLLESFL